MVIKANRGTWSNKGVNTDLFFARIARNKYAGSAKCYKSEASEPKIECLTFFKKPKMVVKNKTPEEFAKV